MSPAKVCPRCGAQYQNLKSTTCPQCFAVLVSVDDATAEELAAARREVEESSEFQEVKAADDERFKEQSFGACLGVVLITFVTLLLAVVLIILAVHHRPAPINRGTQEIISPAPAPQNWGGGALSVLPVAAATLDEVLPPTVEPYRRISADSATVLTGTLTPIFHTAYVRSGASALDVYAIPAGRPTPEQNEFHLGLTLASQIGGNNRPLDFFSTEYWHFAVLGAPGQTTAPAEIRAALIAQFRQQ